MRRLLFPLLCLLLLLTGCGKSAEISSASESENAVADVGVANPWTDHNSLEEAENAVGFELSAPDTIDGYGTPVYRTLSGTLLEILYPGENGNVRIRKQAAIDVSGEDISGDYGSYSEHTAISTPGEDAAITLDGNNGVFSRATWVAGGYAYSVTVDTPVDVVTMSDWTAQIN